MDVNEIVEQRLLKRRVEDLQKQERENGHPISSTDAEEKLILSDKKEKNTTEANNARIDFYKLRFSNQEFETFFNGFKLMAHNWQDLPAEHQYPLLQERNGKPLDPVDEDEEPEPIRHNEIYLTRESMERQMPILWGVPESKFKWLPTRLYFYLSNNKNLKRIYFGEYMDKIYNILWKGEKKTKQQFIFRMFDSDEDGTIGSGDFVFLQNALDQHSLLNTSEVKPLVQHYSNTHLVIYGIPDIKDAIGFDKYKELCHDSTSCIIEEMKLKLCAPVPGMYAKNGSNLVMSYQLPGSNKMVKNDKFTN